MFDLKSKERGREAREINGEKDWASSLYLQDVPLVLEMCGSSRTCVDSSAGLHSF